MENEYEKHYMVAQSLRFKIKRFLFRTRPKKAYFAIFALFAIAFGAFGYVLINTQKLPVQLPSNKILGNSASKELSEAADLVEKVGKLIDLPGETPTIATVTDLTQLSDQPFFKNAQNGDKILIFTEAKKAILYRPSTNKIIETAPLILPTPSKAPTPTTISDEESPTPSVTGTQTSPTVTPSGPEANRENN